MEARGPTAAGRPSLGVGLFLGVTATFYTLLFGYTAFTVAMMALAVAVRAAASNPLVRVAVIAVIAAAHRGDHLAAVPVARRARTTDRTPAPPSTTCPPTARC